MWNVIDCDLLNRHSVQKSLTSREPRLISFYKNPTVLWYSEIQKDPLFLHTFFKMWKFYLHFKENLSMYPVRVLFQRSNFYYRVGTRNNFNTDKRFGKIKKVWQSHTSFLSPLGLWVDIYKCHRLVKRNYF